MPLDELLPKAARLFPDKEAVVCGNQRMTYRTFAERVWRLSHGLRSLGVERRDRVAILHENCHVFLEAYFAAAHLGAILVPLNFRLSSREIAMILADSGARLLIAQDKFRDRAEGLTSQVSALEEILWTQRREDPGGPAGCDYEALLRAQPATPPPDLAIADDEVAHLYYTSGTTGRPKGVMLTHKNVKSHALGTIAELHLTDADHWFHVAPLFHLADAWATFAVTWVGGKHVVLPVFDAAETLQAPAGGTDHAHQPDPHHAQHDDQSPGCRPLRLLQPAGAAERRGAHRPGNGPQDHRGLPLRLHPDLRHDRDQPLPDPVHPQGPSQAPPPGGPTGIQGQAPGGNS